MPHGMNTQEYQIIKKNYPKISDAIARVIDWVCPMLLAEGLITDGQKDKACNGMIPAGKRASDVTGLLLNKVKEDAQNFQTLVGVLQQDMNTFGTVLKHMGVTEGDHEVSTEQPKPKTKSTQEERIQSDFGSDDVANGAGVNVAAGPQPKYGPEKLEEIQESKAPSRKLKEGDEHYESVKQFAQDVELLIQTVNENETWAVLEYMEGPKFSAGQQLSKPVTFGRSKVRLGMFSHYKAALIQTDMGANCEEKLSNALKELPNVKGIIALGIAWGCEGKCELGDVLVATKIMGWNEEKWTDGKLTTRDRFYKPLSKKFQEVFADLPGQWRNFERAEKIKSKAQKALLISTAKLINDEEMRCQVVAQEPEARGGEMEGHVLVKKQTPQLHVAIIKGVSDFADGNKHDEWQLTAAMAAVDYAKYKLDETDRGDLFD